jgi:hypothetical protein
VCVGGNKLKDGLKDESEMSTVVLLNIKSDSVSKRCKEGNGCGVLYNSLIV